MNMNGAPMLDGSFEVGAGKEERPRQIAVIVGPYSFLEGENHRPMLWAQISEGGISSPILIIVEVFERCDRSALCAPVLSLIGQVPFPARTLINPGDPSDPPNSPVQIASAQQKTMPGTDLVIADEPSLQVEEWVRSRDIHYVRSWEMRGVY